MTDPATPAGESTYDLRGPKILIEGDSGAGKTYSLGTMVDWAQKNNYKARVLMLENGLETLLGYWRDPPPGIAPRPVPSCLAWHQITNSTLDLKTLTDGAYKTGIMSYEALTKMIDPDRSQHNVYETMLKTLADFPDDRTGTKLGNISSWGTDTIFMWDSLSELSDMCMSMVIGNKPTASQPDYGVAQNNLYNLLRYLTQGFDPTIVMLSHMRRQTNELTGGVERTVRAIGKAMADDIPKMFSEVLYAKREVSEWMWDTAAVGVSTKTRYLPISGKIKPDFGQIMDKWVKRGKEAA